MSNKKKNTLFICAVLACVAATVSPASAEVITIGKGSGSVWKGLSFNKTLSGPLNDAELNPIYGLSAISSDYLRYIESNELQPIAGYMAMLLGRNTVGLVPRATGVANYSSNDGKQENLTGSFRLPDTLGSTTAGITVNSPSGRSWCLPPVMSAAIYFKREMHSGVPLSRERELSWPTESKPVQR